MSVTVAMQIPVGSTVDLFELPGGNYTPANGIIFVTPSDQIPAQQAGCVPAGLTWPVAPTTACAGTTAGTAAALPAQAGGVYPCTGAAATTQGVIIAAADNVIGREITIGNSVSTAYAMTIYPPTGGNINGAAANTAFVCTAGHGAILTCMSGTPTAPGTWLACG